MRRVVAEDIWQVHYEGFPDDLDEIVDVARVRALYAPGKRLSPQVFAGLVVAASAVGVSVGAFALGIPDLAPESAPVEVSDRGPIAPTGEPLPPGLRVPSGTPLEVRWNDSYYRAVAREHFGDGSVSVHYVGWSDEFDSEVEAADVRLSQAAIEASRGPVPGRGAPVGPDSAVYEGDVLEVAWRDAHYRAVVLLAHPDGRLRVHYAGWDDEFDEDIPRERARRILATGN